MVEKQSIRQGFSLKHDNYYKCVGTAWSTWDRDFIFLFTGYLWESHDLFACGLTVDGRAVKLWYEDWDFRPLSELEVSLL